MTVARAAWWAVLLVFVTILIRNAWVVDDAYITFRTIDNWVNGHGLRWNVDERVQTYTHPLWMLLMSAVHLVTREFFFTSIILNFVLTLGAVAIAAWVLTSGFQRNLWKVPLLLTALLTCKAFVDYASSGLESPLSYVIAVLFYWVWRSDGHVLTAPDIRLKRLLQLSSLLFLTHADLILLCVPMLMAAFVTTRHRSVRTLLTTVLIGTLPLTLWTIFSVIYYGFPFPNTAYAKALATGIPASWKAARGWDYFVTSVSWDYASYMMLAIAASVAIWKREWRTVFMVPGVLLHIAFVIVSGAAATHMGGRFFAVSLFLSVVLFVERIDRPRLGAVVSVAVLLVLIQSPVSALKFGTTAYHRITRNSSMIDTKLYAFQEGSALLNWRPGLRMPNSPWLQAGEAARFQPGKVIVGGAPGSDAIGYFGFGVGPGKFIVDRLGLSDPLLARFPAVRPGSKTGWKSGHFLRLIPDGYVESVEKNGNLLTNPDLRDYYAAIRRVTRGALWKWQRFTDIWDLNVGRYRSGPRTD